MTNPKGAPPVQADQADLAPRLAAVTAAAHALGRRPRCLDAWAEADAAVDHLALWWADALDEPEPEPEPDVEQEEDGRSET